MCHSVHLPPTPQRSRHIEATGSEGCDASVFPYRPFGPVLFCCFVSFFSYLEESAIERLGKEGRPHYCVTEAGQGWDWPARRSSGTGRREVCFLVLIRWEQEARRRKARTCLDLGLWLRGEKNPGSQWREWKHFDFR